MMSLPVSSSGARSVYVLSLCMYVHTYKHILRRLPEPHVHSDSLIRRQCPQDRGPPSDIDCVEVWWYCDRRPESTVTRCEWWLCGQTTNQSRQDEKQRSGCDDTSSTVK
eukprot:GFYU01012227.1.p1 GENE.GFYU01012227.1~~GFYU01012227.1.p1  ORF type:complete len:109 (+),score=1.60 GFYU01012227.1:73-399(+)